MYSVLYKLLKYEHALRFAQTGELRIGTLFEYRKQEIHGSEIGDRGEGTKSTDCEDSISSASQLMSHPFISSFFKGITPESNIVINASFTRVEKSNDLYVYSMADKLVSEAAKELGYDAYIIINNPISYLSCIDKKLRQAASVSPGFGLHKCIYLSRGQLYSMELGVFPAQEHQDHPAIIKDPTYSYQCEVRAIWSPVSGSIEPIIMNCLEALQYCEIGKLLN
jgi:hypothetical protein